MENLVAQGADVNGRSKDGMTPLGIAAFWGYADIVELLLNHGADVNLANKGTLWTPLHSAAFQGHGKVIMKLMEHSPDLNLKDNQGRTATDFASAMDAIWPFFAAAGCRRTTKAQLIDMDIVKKVTKPDPNIPKSEYAHFSRPGSAYIMKPQQMQYSDTRMAVASQTGDVLAGITEENEPQQYLPMFNSVWNN